MGCLCSADSRAHQSIQLSGKMSASSRTAPFSRQETARTVARKTYGELEWTQRESPGFELPTPPLLRDDEIIFLSTSSYSIYNLNECKFTTKSQEIKCDKDDFDVKNTVYTLNTDND